MKRFIEEASRTQVSLLPECLDDFVAEDNPIRVVDTFVEQLDLATLRVKLEPASPKSNITAQRRRLPWICRCSRRG